MKAVNEEELESAGRASTSALQLSFRMLKLPGPKFQLFSAFNMFEVSHTPTIYRVSWPQSSFGNNRFRVIVEKQHKHLDPQKPGFLTFALSQNLPYGKFAYQAPRVVSRKVVTVACRSSSSPRNLQKYDVRI